MKKTVSIIYRLSFIIFALWALLQNAGFRLSAFPETLMNFAVMADTLCLIMIFVIFIISIRGTPGDILLRIKALCTLISVIVLLSNYTLLSSAISTSWILKILLPLMMILDWIFFDKKGSFKIYDPLLWLIAAALLGGLLYHLLKNVFNFPNFLDMLGLFKSKDDLIKLLLGALGAGVLLYIIDNLFSKGGKKSLSGIFAMLYRLLFLLMEIWAFYRLTGLDLSEFISNLKNYARLANFLCFLCIFAVLLYNIIRMNSAKKKSSPFPRLKGAFTIAVTAVFIYYHFISNYSESLSNVNIIHYYIAPFMMVFDWLLFDIKGTFKPLDPLLWLIIPIAYSIINYVIINPVWHPDFKGAATISLAGFFTVMGILLALAYLIYIIDICLSKK